MKADAVSVDTERLFAQNHGASPDPKGCWHSWMLSDDIALLLGTTKECTFPTVDLVRTDLFGRQ